MLPQSALILGVVGHRPDGFSSVNIRRLREQTRSVLQVLRRIGGCVTLVSPIAEGADRLVAHDALTLGIPLTCLLPFPRDVYIRDFTTQASIDDYCDLLDRADSVQELPGAYDSDDDRDAAYAALNDTLIDQIDVLIALWDGDEPRGIGGTAQAVETALGSGIPVIWIDAHAPHEALVLTRAEGAQTCRQTLSSLPALLDTPKKPR
jgi:hypothetical protein